MSADNLGQRLWRAWLLANRVSQAAAARDLHVTDPAVNGWTKGRRPKAHFRKAIAVYTKGEVPEDAWERLEEREAVAAVEPFQRTGTEG